VNPREVPCGPHDPAVPTDIHERNRNWRSGFEWLVAFDLFVRLKIWTLTFIATTVLFTRLGWWPNATPAGASWHLAAAWADCLAWWVLIFNVVYAAVLILLRLMIPTPKEGTYEVEKLNLQLVWATLCGMLTKARYQALFPASLLHEVTTLPPLSWLMARVFGPRTRSAFLLEPKILYPSFVEIGKNVAFGANATLTPHVVTRDTVTIRKIIIEDNVVVGGDAVILAGAHLRAGCAIADGAVVPPNTIVGPNEFWSGNPARRIGMVHDSKVYYAPKISVRELQTEEDLDLGRQPRPAIGRSREAARATSDAETPSLV
jgi:hypothetical protein